VEQALENPIAHPNCTRTFAPHVDDGTHQKVVKASPRRRASSPAPQFLSAAAAQQIVRRAVTEVLEADRRRQASITR